MKNRTRDYYRHHRERSIKRKYIIRKALWGTEMIEDYYKERPVGQLSKGKIHCSCPMCRIKSYDELCYRDKKIILGMEQQLKNYYKK